VNTDEQRVVAAYQRWLDCNPNNEWVRNVVRKHLRSYYAQFDGAGDVLRRVNAPSRYPIKTRLTEPL